VLVSLVCSNKAQQDWHDLKCKYAQGYFSVRMQGVKRAVDL